VNNYWYDVLVKCILVYCVYISIKTLKIYLYLKMLRKVPWHHFQGYPGLSILNVSVNITYCMPKLHVYVHEICVFYMLSQVCGIVFTGSFTPLG